MILNDKDAIARLTSPSNLINRLGSLSNGNGKNHSRASAMGLFGLATRGVNHSAVISRPVIEQPKQEVVISFNPFDKQDKEAAPGNTNLASDSRLSVPSIPEQNENHPQLEDLLDNANTQIKLGTAHDNALDLLNSSLLQLTRELDNVKPDKLPSVIAAASKTVDSIRRERNEASKSGKNNDVHFHFYTPAQKAISDYEVIEVGVG